MKKYFFGIVVIIIFLVIHSLRDVIPDFLRYLTNNDEELYSVAVHAFLSVQVFFYYLTISIFFLDFNFLTIFKKHPGKKKLSDWLDSLHTDDSLSSYIDSEKKRMIKVDDDLEQLNTLKHWILEYCKYEKQNLYLFKEFYASKLKQNNKPIWLAVLSPIILSIPFMIRQQMTGNSIEIYGAELSIFYLLFFGGMTIVTIYKQINEPFKRYAVIYHTTNAIIENIERRENKGEIVDLQRDSFGSLNEEEHPEVYLSKQK